VIDDLIATAPTAGEPPDLNLLPFSYELDLSAGQKTQLVADLLWNRDLTLARYPRHAVRVALVLLLL